MILSKPRTLERIVPLNERALANPVESLLEELKYPRHHLSTIATGLFECEIDYAVIGSLAVGVHNYLRFAEDIDVLVSRETYSKIGQYLIENGYLCRLGSGRYLYYGMQPFCVRDQAITVGHVHDLHC